MSGVFPLTPLPCPINTLDKTHALATSLAPVLQAGDMITFSGDLGAGKTAFIRALIQTLSSRQGSEALSLDVPSPTFTLVQSYNFPEYTLSHYDLYRVQEESELLELGVEEAFATQVSCIEWPEKLGRHFNQNSLCFYMQHQNDHRSLHCFCLTQQAYDHWIQRLQATSFCSEISSHATL